MSYLIGQIIICLLIAFLLGLLVGWLLKSILCERKLRESEDKLDAERRRKVEAVHVDKPAAKPVMPEVVDDLKEIQGVGPVLEKMLHKNGITTLKQVAQLSSSDIEGLSAKLDCFNDRIIRDVWVSKAKDLHRKKYGEDL